MSPLIPPGHLETTHTMFSKPASLRGTFWSQSFAQLQNCVFFALPSQASKFYPWVHFRICNWIIQAGPGLLWGVSSLLPIFILGKNRHQNSLFTAKLACAPYFKNIAGLHLKNGLACLKANSHFVQPTQNILVPRNEDDFEIVLDYSIKRSLKNLQDHLPCLLPTPPSYTHGLSLTY